MLTVLPTFAAPYMYICIYRTLLHTFHFSFNSLFLFLGLQSLAPPTPPPNPLPFPAQSQTRLMPGQPDLGPEMEVDGTETALCDTSCREFATEERPEDRRAPGLSARVSGLAEGLYGELERLVSLYGEEALRGLMPLVVTVLESLDSACESRHERQVELELLKEDNEQLLTQYERERNLRKQAEEKYIEYEDALEQERHDLLSRLETSQLQLRQFELRGKNATDQIIRLEEREAELKKEYSSLYQRHTEMLQAYSDHLERFKILQTSYPAEAFLKPRIRKEHPVSVGVFAAPSTEQTVTTVSRPEVPGCDSWRSGRMSYSHYNTSLEEELDSHRLIVEVTQDATYTAEGETQQENSSTEGKRASDSSANKDAGEDKSQQVASQELTSAPDLESGVISTEVQGIIDSTPELRGPLDTRTSFLEGEQDNDLVNNNNSLYEELSSAGLDLGDVDEGADLRGVGKEVENLILENAQLLEAKQALCVAREELQAQLERMGSERELLQGETGTLKATRTRLEGRVKQLEEELRKMKQELERAWKANGDNEEEGEVPMAQRKRFTRVEMARVLMERNQYKERLMELQEAVRWTEMIRASREYISSQEKKRSSFWQFFSRLFSSSSGTSRRPAPQPHLMYNAPSSQVAPASLDEGPNTPRHPSHAARAFDFLYDDGGVSACRREQKREQYRQVRAHVREDDGRLQAFGWSLPSKYRHSGTGNLDETKMRNLPVPVYCRPLCEKDPIIKLWCATGVNLSGGRTRDGGSVVGASVFYGGESGIETTLGETLHRSDSQSSLERLELELQEKQKELRARDELSSLVWVCASTQDTGKVLVIDANRPERILQHFPVCNSHILCITSVPGARETDYSSGEDFQHDLSPAVQQELCDGFMEATGNQVGVEGSSNDGSTETDGDNPPWDTHSGHAETTTEGRTEEAVEATEVVTATVCDGMVSEVTSSETFTEHVFTDPLPDNYETPQLQSEEADVVRDGVRLLPAELELMYREAGKMNSLLPTVWLGAQNGCVYVHSAVAQWRRCLHAVHLKDSILCIVHIKGRVLVAVADGTLAIFHRASDGQWELGNYHLLELGRRQHAVRCMVSVHSSVWCGLRNKILVLDPKTLQVQKSFDAHPRKESQVRQLAWQGDGVWVSIRLDSTLRLYHAHTYQHLQDIDIEPYVSKMLGTGSLGFSFVRITSLMLSCGRLWVGTGNGVIISVPLSEAVISSESGSSNAPAKATGNEMNAGTTARPGMAVRVYGSELGENLTPATFVPYCSMADAQLCFHGHRDAVKFFLAVPGAPGDNDVALESGVIPGGSIASLEPSHARSSPSSMLIMSGGEGYVDFRIGDGEETENLTELKPSLLKDLSHIIVWQVPSQSYLAEK
uniref:Sperm associated antigen 9a n=1 Tax=Eptatretus burgeri TaxID=7764 RepID=A0A8C4PXR5_EPTBU